MPPEEQRMPLNTNPMCYTFPRIAACDYHRFGPGGGQENVNAICILSLNIINDKVSFNIIFKSFYTYRSDLNDLIWLIGFVMT